MDRKTAGRAHDGRERKAFVDLMTLLGSAQQALRDEMKGADLGDLGPLHMRLICLCLESPGMPQQQLATRIGRDRSQVAHLVHALVKAGFLTREADPQDARVLRLTLTPAGATQAGRFMALEDQVAKRIFRGLVQEELAELQRLMAMVAHAMVP